MLSKTGIRRSLLATAIIGAAAAQAAAAPTGKLRIAISTDPDTLDPITSYLPISYTIDNLVLDGLFKFDAENQIEKDLAADYSYSADGTVLTVKLVKGRKFASGAPVDAAAVAASFTRLLDPANKSIYLGLYKVLGQVKAVGDDRVEFHLSERNGHVLVLLASAAASIVDVNAEKKLGTEFGRHPAGSGPYVVKDYIGGERVSLVPNPNYDGPKPAKLAEIDFMTAPEDGSRVALMETGAVDIVERVPPESIASIKDLPNASVLVAPSMFSINAEMVLRGPLTDKRVRKALNLAVDRAGITKGVLGVLGTPSVGFVGPGTQDSLRKTFAPLSYDPAKAKALLKEAGYKPGQLSLTITCPTGRYIKDVQVCQALQAEWQAIGVNVKADIIDRGSWLKIIGMPPSERKDNMALVGRGTPGMDFTLYRLFYSGVSTNRTGFNDPKVDELLTKGRTTTDPKEQVKIYGEIQKIIWDEQPFVFLWYQNQVFGVSKAVTGFKARRDEVMVLDDVTVKR
jgi:ABC-type transport system substrate-binding protein